MPEPGFNDPDFNRPVTGRTRRRNGKPVKLPVEYTEFRLSDGRFLGEVLGEGFFDVENSQPIPESERQQIRDGNYALAGMFREDPQFRSRPEPADGSFDGEGARGSPAPANRGLGTAAARGASMLSHASPTFEPEAEDADGAVAGLAMSGRMAKGVGSGLAKPDVAALGVGPATIADMDDAGLGGLAETVLDIDKLAAVEPKTYDDYMRYGKAIGEMAGYSHVPLQRLATVLSGLRGAERNIANAPEGLNGEPSPRQQRALAASRADAAGFLRRLRGKGVGPARYAARPAAHLKRRDRHDVGAAGLRVQGQGWRSVHGRSGKEDIRRGA